MEFRFDIADLIALIVIGWVVGLITGNVSDVILVQAGFSLMDWIGRKLIDRWIERKYGEA